MRIMKLNGRVMYRESEKTIFTLKAIAKKEKVSLGEVIRTLIQWALIEYRRGKKKIKISD